MKSWSMCAFSGLEIRASAKWLLNVVSRRSGS